MTGATNLDTTAVVRRSARYRHCVGPYRPVRDVRTALVLTVPVPRAPLPHAPLPPAPAPASGALTVPVRTWSVAASVVRTVPLRLAPVPSGGVRNASVRIQGVQAAWRRGTGAAGGRHARRTRQGPGGLRHAPTSLKAVSGACLSERWRLSGRGLATGPICSGSGRATLAAGRVLTTRFDHPEWAGGPRLGLVEHVPGRRAVASCDPLNVQVGADRQRSEPLGRRLSAMGILAGER